MASFEKEAHEQRVTNRTRNKPVEGINDIIDISFFTLALDLFCSASTDKSK